MANHPLHPTSHPQTIITTTRPDPLSIINNHVVAPTFKDVFLSQLVPPIYTPHIAHLFGIPPSQCAPAGSAERCTITDCITCISLQTFLFWFPHTIAFSPVFQCLSLHMSEFTYVSICFTPMFHLFAIPPSQCAPASSAERSINIHLVTWPAHNLLIA